jgi:hypothetical protein
MSTRRGALAVCTKGRIGVITGTKTTPEGGTTWYGVNIRTLGKWQSRDPRFLSDIDEHHVKTRMGLERWDTLPVEDDS